jgi:molecular chaperone GrpE (heat shock protein)
MNDDFSTAFPGADSPAAPARDEDTLGASTIFKLCSEVIQLRERNDRTHRDFERTLAKTRDELKGSFDSFAAATQRAYQDLRKETVGEKKFSMDLLMLLLEISQDLDHIMEHRPPADDAEKVKGWIEAVGVQTRKVQAAVSQKNVKEYEARPGEAYNPALHKRVGSERVEGMGPLLVARTVKKGYASQQPDFILQRPEVIVSE